MTEVLDLIGMTLTAWATLEASAVVFAWIQKAIKSTVDE